TVQEGLTVRLDAIIAGGAPVSGSGTLGDQGTPAASPLKSGLPGREFFSTFLEQPWAWAAAGVALVCLIAAALVWTMGTPQAIPVVGSYIPTFSGNTDTNFQIWTAVKVGMLVVAGLAGIVALGLFVWPTLP